MPQPYLGNPEKVPSRIRLHHLQQAKDNGEKFAMLTAYDVMMAEIFDSAGIEMLLVGDSAANTVLGYESTLPITLDEMIMFTKAVANGAKRAMVVADLPFGSYEQSPAQAVATAVRLMKEGHAHAVKMEGTAQYAEHVRAMVLAGVPVIGHIGFTPQSEHALGGYRVQGRGDAVEQMKHDAVQLQDAGAFCILMEMVPSPVAAKIDAALKVPTIGIGAGNSTTGQVLVWQDMLGLGGARTPRFVKKYADLREVVGNAVREYHQDVVSGTFPSAEYEFKE
ncbi:3-methyl-2-oxobutanoate hydroxymethyltransferase [Glutamicibacter sp. NPDC087831]|uniref:3-methyl-2-oxobutanoate hydroxymethyltransferase n=1 Tax=Glutamicibacter sp. NPDC087831 TaxID=3363998 RepID=UPI0037FAA7AC